MRDIELNGLAGGGVIRGVRWSERDGKSVCSGGGDATGGGRVNQGMETKPARLLPSSRGAFVITPRMDTDDLQPALASIDIISLIDIIDPPIDIMTRQNDIYGKPSGIPS